MIGFGATLPRSPISKKIIIQFTILGLDGKYFLRLIRFGIHCVLFASWIVRWQQQLFCVHSRWLIERSTRKFFWVKIQVVRSANWKGTLVLPSCGVNPIAKIGTIPSHQGPSMREVITLKGGGCQNGWRLTCHCRNISN